MWEISYIIEIQNIAQNDARIRHSYHARSQVEKHCGTLIYYALIEGGYACLASMHAHNEHFGLLSECHVELEFKFCTVRLCNIY